MTSDDKVRYWRRVRALTLLLLGLWFAVSFGVAFFARELSLVSVGGWPLHFYLASQGVTLVYLGLIGTYALAMKRLDQLASHRSGDGDGEGDRDHA
jgi:putative solute:sodium symporter small subunit